MKFKHIPAFVMGSAFALMASISMAQAEKLVIATWDGYTPKDMVEKFKAATGIDLELTMHATNEEIMGKVTASGGEGYDIIFVSSPFAEALKKLDMLAPIDHSKIPNFANLYPEASQLKHDPGNTYSWPYQWGTIGILYDSAKVPAGKATWKWMFDPAHQVAPFVMMDEMRSMLGI